MSWVPIAIMAVQAAGTIMQGIGSANAAASNAKVAQMQGAEDMSAAAARASQTQQQGTEQIGEAMANVGASGVETSSSTPLAVMSSMARQVALNKQLTIWQGETEQESENYQAQIDKQQRLKPISGR